MAEMISRFIVLEEDGATELEQFTAEFGDAKVTYATLKSGSIDYYDSLLNEIFSDDFSGDFPGSKWVYENSSTVSEDQKPRLDYDVGNEAPSLAIPFPKFGQNFSVSTATNPFDASAGFTISVDVRNPETPSGSWVRSFSIIIVNQADQKLMASAEISPSTAKIEYRASKGFDGRTALVQKDYFEDTDFHNFVFTIDELGNASWSRDGVTQMNSVDFPIGDYELKFRASGYAGPSFDTNVYNFMHYVDNVIVTVP